MENIDYDEEYVLDEEEYEVNPGVINIPDAEAGLLAKDKYEVTFAIKQEFKDIFIALHKIHEEYQATGIINASIMDLVLCIDYRGKVVNKKMLKNLFVSNQQSMKMAKKIAKRYLGYRLKNTETYWVSGFDNMFSSYSVISIFEAKGEVYCRAVISIDSVNQPRVTQSFGSIIGTLGKKITAVVRVAYDFAHNTYKPLEYEVNSDKEKTLKIYESKEVAAEISIVDKTKLYMVEAHVVLPGEISKMVKRVDALDQVIESVKESGEKEKFLDTFRKMTFSYDMACAFININAYSYKLGMLREYEKENLLKGLDEDIQKAMMVDITGFPTSKYNEDLFNLANRIVEIKRNEFSDNFTAWDFNGTFSDISRSNLEAAFDQIKKNMMLNGMTEQYINIRVAEL